MSYSPDVMTYLLEELQERFARDLMRLSRRKSRSTSDRVLEQATMKSLIATTRAFTLVNTRESNPDAVADSTLDAALDGMSFITGTGSNKPAKKLTSKDVTSIDASGERTADAKATANALLNELATTQVLLEKISTFVGVPPDSVALDDLGIDSALAQGHKINRSLKDIATLGKQIAKTEGKPKKTADLQQSEILLKAVEELLEEDLGNLSDTVDALRRTTLIQVMPRIATQALMQQVEAYNQEADEWRANPEGNAALFDLVKSQQTTITASVGALRNYGIDSPVLKAAERNIKQFRGSEKDAQKSSQLSRAPSARFFKQSSKVKKKPLLMDAYKARVEAVEGNMRDLITQLIDQGSTALDDVLTQVRQERDALQAVSEKSAPIRAEKIAQLEALEEKYSDVDALIEEMSKPAGPASGQ